jgi:ribosomal protein L29
MENQVELVNRIIKIARNFQVSPLNPLSLAELTQQLGDVKTEQLNYALMVLMAQGKINTRKVGRGLSIIWVS